MLRSMHSSRLTQPTIRRKVVRTRTVRARRGKGILGSLISTFAPALVNAATSALAGHVSSKINDAIKSRVGGRRRAARPNGGSYKLTGTGKCKPKAPRGGAKKKGHRRMRHRTM